MINFSNLNSFIARKKILWDCFLFPFVVLMAIWSCACEKFHFHVAVPTYQHQVLVCTICLVAIYVMYSEYLWDFIVPAFLAAVRSGFKKSSSVSSWASVCFAFIGFPGYEASAFCGTALSSSFYNFSYCGREFFTAYNAVDGHFRSGFTSWKTAYDWMFSVAFSAAIFFSCSNYPWRKKNLYPASKAFYFDTLKMGLVIRKKSARSSDPVVPLGFVYKWLAASTGAEFRALVFLAFRQVWPKLRVVLGNIFGHGLCLLGGPSLARSWASFSWFKDNMLASYLEGVLA